MWKDRKKYVSQKSINTAVVDWVVIVFAIFTLICNLILPGSRYLADIACIVSGVAGLFYLAIPIVVFLSNRPKFDWHLVNGNFLTKVIALVLLFPSIITSFFLVYNYFQCEDSTYSPKNLIYDDNLYTYPYCDTLSLENRRIFTDSVFLASHDLEVIHDSIVVSKSKLPNSIRSAQEDPSVFWAVYYHFVDPGNQHMTVSQSGRGWSALIAIFGIFLLNGLLVSSIIGWIESRKEKWLSGDIKRYRTRDLGKYKYAVIIGANEIAASVIKNLFTPPIEGNINNKCEGVNDYVIIQTTRNPEDVRVELASHLEEEYLKRVIIYKALRDSIAELKSLHIEYSTEIYVLGESTSINGGETFHDAMNMRCVNLIAKELNKTRDFREKERIKSGKSVRKVCKVLFEYQTTSSIFQFSDLSEEFKKNIIFIPFNRYDSWAKAVITDNFVMEDCNDENREQLNYTPLDGSNGISENADTHVHFVIVGMSKMGVAMGVQAMLEAHYLNFAQAETETDLDKRERLKNLRRTRITFIDVNADKEMLFFKGRYENLFSLTRNRYVDVYQCKEEDLRADSTFRWHDPMESSSMNWSHLSEHGENFIDLELEFIKGELESEGVRTYLRNISDTNNDWVKNSNLTIAICLNQTHQAVAAGLYMPVIVYEKAQEIWIYQRESADIVLNLIKTSQKDKRYKKLKPFGMLYSEYMTDRSQYLKAMLVNGAYELNGKIDGKEIRAEERSFSKKETYSDLRASWKKLSIDKMFSNKYFADSIKQKIRSINAVGLPSSSLKNAILIHSESLARSEHNRWNIQQLLLGFAPCPRPIDEEFVILNANYQAACEAVDKWRKSMGWEELSNDRQEEFKKNDATYKKLIEKRESSKAEFKRKKESCKEGENRIHPNLCSYDHLDKVDFEAKGYDIYLNSIIPMMKLLVDDIIEATKLKNENKQ